MSAHLLDRRMFCVGALAAAGALLLPAAEGRAARPFGSRSATAVTQVAVWGDSMANHWPRYLEGNLGVPVAREGIGGATITEIAAAYFAWDQPNTGHVLWGGHTDFNKNNNSGDLVVPTIASMVAAADPGMFFVIGLTNGPGYEYGTNLYVQVTEGINPQLQEAYGDRYADVRRYLITDGLQVAGLAPTAQDALDIANDTPPVSLRVDDGNPGHLNLAGRMVVAGRMDTLIREAGWLG